MISDLELLGNSYRYDGEGTLCIFFGVIVDLARNTLGVGSPLGAYEEIKETFVFTYLPP